MTIFLTKSAAHTPVFKHGGQAATACKIVKIM